MMHWGDYGWGMGFGFFGLLFMLLFWVLLILGIVYLIKALSRSSNAAGREEDALEILKKRYARGDIGREEFERIREDIRKT